MGGDRDRDTRPDWSTTELGFDARGTVRPSLPQKKRSRVSTAQSPAREATLVGRVARRLRETPGCYFRNIHGSQYHAGIPDLVGCLHGFFFAIEVKKAKGKLSLLQVQEIRKIQSSRGWAESFDQYDKFAAWWQIFEALCWKNRMT